MRRHPTPFLLTTTLVASLAALALGCGAEPPGGGEETADREEMALYVASKLVWKSPSIPVCWVSPKPEHAAQRAWTQEAAAESWEAVSAVRFTGWGTCAKNDGKSLRIAISDENPYAYIGTSGVWLSFNVLLNFSFKNWSAGFCSNNLEYCVKTIAVHELGHALGFDHEQNRPDAPSWCEQDAYGAGDTTIGPWDLDSVMNYCNPDWNGDGTLSAIDIQGVQQVYGTAPVAQQPDDPPPVSCTYACKDYGYATGDCWQGWYCDGSCIEQTGCK